MRSAPAKYDTGVGQEAKGREQHARTAVRLRALAVTLTTAAAKATVLRQVQEHERLAGMVSHGNT
jgi:hypothetical protein